MNINRIKTFFWKSNISEWLISYIFMEFQKNSCENYTHKIYVNTKVNAVIIGNKPGF